MEKLTRELPSGGKWPSRLHAHGILRLFFYPFERYRSQQAISAGVAAPSGAGDPDDFGDNAALPRRCESPRTRCDNVVVSAAGVGQTTDDIDRDTRETR
jgi:hypothetical protein